MHRGYIKLWRKTFDSGIHREHATFTLWIWILCNVTRKQIKYVARGQEIILEPGELIFGRNKLASEMNLTSQTIRTCLKNLKKWKNLTIRSTNRFSILKVTNWETYQETENSINQQTNQELTSNQPATNQPTNHKTRSKEVKNVKKKETTYSEDFEKFWSAYPKRIGKPKAWESWNRHNGNRPTIETIVLKIDDLKKTRQWQKDDGDFIPLPTTWLNRCGWDDECKVEIKSNKPKGFSMEELHAIADAGRKPRGL